MKAMGQFRDQLHAAQLSYHTPSYPEDLASQLLPVRRSFWPRFIGTLVAGTAAAVIVIALVNHAIEPNPPQSETVAVKRPVRASSGMPGLPQMPKPTPAPDLNEPMFLPALPSFPSLGDVIGLNQTNESTNESTNETPTPRESL